MVECFIKKIFEGESDEEIHHEFVKFGKGEFKNRYKIEIKKQKGGKQFKISTSPEFSNYLIKKCLKDAPGTIEVKGIIISTFDISSDLNFEIKNVKKYMGMQKTIIDTTIKKQDLIDLMEKYPNVFYGLSFSTPNNTLKIRKKSPRSAKPSKGGKKKKDKSRNFCRLKTLNKNIVKDLLFDFDNLNFDEIKIKHTVKIDKIIYPKNVEGMKPNEIRKNSKRGGKMTREIEIDGKKETKEKEFVV